MADSDSRYQCACLSKNMAAAAVSAVSAAPTTNAAGNRQPSFHFAVSLGVSQSIRNGTASSTTPTALGSRISTLATKTAPAAAERRAGREGVPTVRNTAIHAKNSTERLL